MTIMLNRGGSLAMSMALAGAAVPAVPKDEKVLTTTFLAVLDGLQDQAERHKRIAEMCQLLGLDQVIIQEKVQRYDQYMAQQAEAKKARERAARAKAVYDELNGRTLQEVVESDDEGNCPGLDLAEEAISLGMKLEVIVKQGDKTKDPDVGKLIVFLSGVATPKVNTPIPVTPAAAQVNQGVALAQARGLVMARHKRRFVYTYNGEQLPPGTKLADIVKANFPESIAAQLLTEPSALGYGPNTKFGAFQAIQKDPELAPLFQQVEVQG